MAAASLEVERFQLECCLRLASQLYPYPDRFGADPNAPHRAVTGLNGFRSAP